MFRNEGGILTPFTENHSPPLPHIGILTNYSSLNWKIHTD
jgi:hypothetical protein